ncbi:MAG: hypothetical protein HY078_08880 [Elusimicrobia bacterium]|nr:hypothetical protein [Elusimicrobiota bacterium]
MIPSLALALSLFVLALPAAAQPRLASRLHFDASPIQAFRPGLEAVAAWAGTESGGLILGSDSAWRAFSSVIGPQAAAERAFTAAPLAQALSAGGDAHLSKRLTRIADAPEEEQRELVRELDAARARASRAVASAVHDALEAEVRGAREPAAGSGEWIDRLVKWRRLRDDLSALEATGLYGEAVEAAHIEVGAAMSRWRSRMMTANAGVGWYAVAPGEALQDYIERTQRELIETDPALFFKKMKKASKDPFNYARVMMPQFYGTLAQQPEAARLKRSVRIVISGDVHHGNVDVLRRGENLVPQPDDLDDSIRAPVALELSRMLLMLAAGTQGDEKKARAVIEDARAAYRTWARRGFRAWTAAVQEEDAVKNANAEPKEWSSEGKPIHDPYEAGWALEAAGLDPEKWRARDRRGSGGSSIGVRRITFSHPDRDDAFELKEQRPSAALAFGAVASEALESVRVAAGYAALRQVMDESTVLESRGASWLRRHRFSKELELDASDPASVARVLAGMTAQMHRRAGGSPSRLVAAARGVTTELVLRILREFEEHQTELRRLLDAGTWADLKETA